MDDFNKASLEKQAQPISTPFPTPRTYEGVEYYGADDVAKIIGVTRRNVLYWHQQGLFLADKRAHDGRYLYTVERVEQLKSVYHPKWMRGGYEPSPADDDATNAQIRDDIKKAQANIFNLPEKDRRGLEDDTLRHFGFGYLSKWRHPKRPNDQLTARIIAPLGGRNAPAYNAILTNSDRQRVKPVRDNTDKPPKWTDKCLTANNKRVFNPADLTCPIVAATEGEIDCASLWQAVQRGKKLDAGNEANFAGFVALGGTGGASTDLINRLKALPTKPKVIVLFDADQRVRQPGQKESTVEKILRELRDIGVVAVAEFLDDFMSDDDKKSIGGKVDANAILQHFGEDKLYRIFARLVAKAKADFPKAEYEMQQFKAAREAAKKHDDRPRDLSPEITDLIARIKDDVPISRLVEKGYLQHSARGNAHPKGYCCPWCNSGNGTHKTGALAIFDDYVVCHKCNAGGDVLTVYAEVNNMSLRGAEFFNTLRGMCDEFGVAYDPKIFDPPENKSSAQYCKTGNVDADEWQKVKGVFDEMLYLEIRAAEKFLQELTPETLTATVASSSSTARKIALCTFYDFALTAAQKFWLRLEDAIANAVAQVKEAKTTGEILSDDVRLLAQLKVNAVRKTVDREVKAVQRAHEKFQVEAKAKQQAKAAKARLDNYMQNAPTTRKVIDDCPVDLIIPPDVYFGQEVGLQVILPNGTVSQRPAALAPVTVTKKFRNESTGGVMFEIAIKTCDAWRRHEVDGKSLQSARSVDVLGNFGLPIEDAGALAKFFARIIAANDKTLTVTKVFTQTGWTDDDSTDFVYPSQDADYCVRRAGFDFAKELACRGDVDTWTKTFVDAMKAGGSKARVYVGTALAAPLIRKFNIPNLQTHLHGTSGSGKTALEKLTASILGNPRLLIRTFEATPKNRQAVAAAFNDLPMFLDELGTINGKKGEDALSQSIYAYSLGNQNQAQQRNGDTRPLVKFYGSRLSTGERAILKNHDARGNFKRLLEIQCDKMFDDRVAAELHLVAEKNFGHFGRKWIEYVTKHVDEICAQFDDYAVIFTGGHNQREPTLIKAVVAAAVAFQHFMICAGAQDEFDEATCENDAGTIIETLPTLDDMSDDVRAIAALKSFVAAHPKHFMFECEDDKQTISDTTVWATPTFGKHFSDGRVAFLPTELQKILEDELGFASKDALVDAWHRKGLLVTNGNRRDYRITLGKTRPATICFKQSVLSEGYDPRTVYAPPIISSAQNETD